MTPFCISWVMLLCNFRKKKQRAFFFEAGLGWHIWFLQYQSSTNKKDSSFKQRTFQHFLMLFKFLSLLLVPNDNDIGKTFWCISMLLLSNLVLSIVISRLKSFHKKPFPYEINKNHLPFVDWSRFTCLLLGNS